MPPKPPVRSVSQVPKLEIDNDIVITKLCDENKRLKEHQTQLVSKYEEGEEKRLLWNFAYFKYLIKTISALRENMEIQNKNDQLQKELIQARREVSEKIYLQKTVEKYVTSFYGGKVLWQVSFIFLAYKSNSWTW